MTIDEAIERYADNSEYESDHGNLQGCLEFKQLVKWLKELKQLREQTSWIPVSERLPEENGFYLVTYDGEICGENEPFTGLAEYENGKWVDDEEDYQCVLAWMPLPEPYKEESEG